MRPKSHVKSRGTGEITKTYYKNNTESVDLCSPIPRVISHLNIVLFTYYKYQSTGLTLYKVSTRQPNVTTRHNTNGNRVKSTNNPPDGRTQISHPGRYFFLTFYKVSTQQPNVTTRHNINGNRVKSTNNPREERTQLSRSVCYFYNKRLCKNSK